MKTKTQQLNFSEEEIAALRELVAERIETKRAAAAASAAAEENKLQQQQASKDAWDRHFENLYKSANGENCRASEEAIKRNQNPDLAASLDAVTRRRW